MKLIFQVVFLAIVGIVAGWLGLLLFRLRWPAQIPPELRFEHELATEKKLRDVAEALAGSFPGPAAGNVVCLGPVRGSAARVLFHSGPNNSGKNRNIHRPDYVLEVRRLGKQLVSLTLETNKPYSYLRIRRNEVAPLVAALRQAFGGLTSV